MPGKSKALQKAEAEALAEGRIGEPGYSQSFNARATEYCMLGATNEELAAFFRVALPTVERWMVEYPRFRRAIEDGREAADARVARAMHRRAVGMTIKKERAYLVQGKLKTLFLREELPPDVNAGFNWLANRQQGRWRSSNTGANANGGFDLVAFVAGLSAGVAKGLAQQPAPGDDAKQVEPLDVVSKDD